MLGKLSQILRDHRAMNAIRRDDVSVTLTFGMGGGSLGVPIHCGFECELHKGQQTHFNQDPAEAILGALAVKMTEGKRQGASR